ncbi:polymeric immunoglobulin receptor-like [Salminus brasiliensis]|uniref:polymeric immunoglobulin receptor-like n=1 Tax=Salminus brasiliensis TaxID=930266 RepID=UPI003B82C78B
MTRLLFLLAFLLHRLPDALCTVTSTGDLAVLEGQSVTVPCHYNPQYTQNVKYWCRGSMKEFCSSLARTDDPKSAPFGKGKVTIADDPSQHLFMVTMTDLKEEDSGWYWCGVEVGDMWSLDRTASLYISVIHGMSVVNSMVSGEEGGSVVVQCHYSEKHRESEKRWCRSGHLNSCKVTDANGTFSSRSLLISDDRKDTVTVTMRRLEMRDAGWYWCGAGQQQVTVHVLVTPRPTTTLSVTTPVSLTTQQPLILKAQDSKSHSFWQPVLMVCGALLLLLTAVLVPWRIWEHCKKKRGAGDTKANLMVCLADRSDGENTSLLFLNTSVQQAQMNKNTWVLKGPERKRRQDEIGRITEEMKTIKQDDSRSNMDSFWILIFLLSCTESWSWERELTLPPGGTITIPCHYNLKYIQHKKYWCYDAGALFNYCKILAYANNTKDKVTVTDYPAQSLFTVTMRDLQSGNTGSYWCVVEIEGLSRDVDEQMFITVKADPDLSVVESSVSGQEGGSVSVQCLYSAGYQKKQKQWCRSKDSRWYTVGRTKTAQGSAVQISDDGRRSFRVEMSGLQKSDAGWYWCKTGKLQFPVHLSVSGASPATTSATTATTTATMSSGNENATVSEDSSDPTIQGIGSTRLHRLKASSVGTMVVAMQTGTEKPIKTMQFCTAP